MQLLLDSIDDPRLKPYRNLKDRELARLGGRFIAESDLIVRRLVAVLTKWNRCWWRLERRPP